MNRKIRVLFTQSQPEFSATSSVHSLLMRHFDPDQVEVHVACVAQTRAGVPDSLRILGAIPGVHLRQTRFGPTVYRRSRPEVAKSAVTEGLPAAVSLAGLAAYMKRRRIDIIHFAERPRDAFYGEILSRVTGAKSIFHLHLEPADWMSSRVQWAMRQADGLICVSQSVARVAIARGQQPERTHVVLNGIDLAQWDPNADGAAIRSELSIPADALVLSIVSRIVPSKGHEQLLRALGRARDDMPPFRLIVVGDDDPTVLPPGFSQVAALRELAQQLGLADRVTFTGKRRDVRDILAASDMYTMPSLDEAFGMAFVEAMAMKRPVVALDVGGTREVVEDGQSGLISPPGDDDRLAANILRLANDPTLRRTMGTAGRSRVERDLTAARMAREVEDVYRSVLAPQAKNQVVVNALASVPRE